jgi:hypothetical protein
MEKSIHRLCQHVTECQGIQGNVPIDVEVGEQALPALSR